MMSKKFFASAGLGLAATVTAHIAWAGPLIQHSAGAKLLVGADVWSEPSDLGGDDGLGFKGNAGGFSYGAAGYYELGLLRYIGLELDLAYQHGTFHRNVTINNTIEVTETVTINSLRLPILAKANLPLPLGRIWVGAGPEFTITSSSEVRWEQTGGPTVPIIGTVETKDVKPTFLTAGLGLVIELPAIGIDIPVELRASKNLSQPDAWGDRVTQQSDTAATIQAESSWVYRLGAGIGVRF